jgi:diguanylate cyclase (GGDEF)-like protein
MRHREPQLIRTSVGTRVIAALPMANRAMTATTQAEIRARDESDRGIALWEPHFRDPESAFAEATALATSPGEPDERTHAWCALTLGFHHLFFDTDPGEARRWMDVAVARFDKADDRRGSLLAAVGIARLDILMGAADAGRDRLLALYPEAQQVLPPEDRFFLLNAIGAAHYFTDRLDEAIRYLYEALEALRDSDASPQHPAIMSNLAAALLTIGDYVPARELAEAALARMAEYSNHKLVLFARSNYAQALAGCGDHSRALRVVDQLLADAATTSRAAQNHYMSTAAEILAQHGRLDEAARCADSARAIHAEFPGGFNEVHSRWADAVIADAGGDRAVAIERLRAASDAAERHRHLPVECKALARLAERYADARDFEQAYASSRRLLAAETQRLSHRASAKYYLLRVEHELSHARAERDRALAQRQEMQRLNEELARVNADLTHKMIQVEALQAQLAVEAVHDPLTQLFNRRYLDSVMPGLIAAAVRRGSPLALALVDLDHFKLVNDRHGHPAGDAVLREVGRVLPMSLRPSDVVCRYGGEEFCIVLPDADGTGAEKALASLAARLTDLRVAWNGSSLGGFTFSAGVAVLRVNGTVFADLLHAADRALYQAKDAGRNRILVADATSSAS